MGRERGGREGCFWIFKDLPDPHQRGKITCPLDEVLLLCLLAVFGGAETFVDIARFGEKKLDLLRRFQPFRDGTPSHDHLGDIFCDARRRGVEEQGEPGWGVWWRCCLLSSAPAAPWGKQNWTLEQKENRIARRLASDVILRVERSEKLCRSPRRSIPRR